MPIKSVEVFLDRKRYFRFGFNALCALEKAGFTIEDLQRIFPAKVGKKDKIKISLTDLRIMIWAGLLHEDENLTLPQVGQILDDADWISRADDIGEAIGNAILASFPEVKEDEKKEERPDRKSNGVSEKSSSKTTS